MASNNQKGSPGKARIRFRSNPPPDGAGPTQHVSKTSNSESTQVFGSRKSVVAPKEAHGMQYLISFGLGTQQ